MHADLIDPTDKRWAELLRRTRHDVYHTPAYSIVAARHEGATPTAFYAEDGGTACLAPLLIRPLPPHLDAPSDWRDAASPYGYPGPLIAGDATPETFCALLEALSRCCRDFGLISTFIRCHPLLPFGDTFSPGKPRTKEGETVYIDLTQDGRKLWRDLRANHRIQIAKLVIAGYRAVMDSWQHFPAFIEMYLRNMERVGADPFYFFPRQYFYNLRRALADSLHLCCVIAPEGAIAAAGLFTEHCGFVQYHLGCSSSVHLPKAPSKLMFYAVQHWAKERNNRLFHLGGGRGCTADSLFRFKAGFSRLRSTYCTYRMVLNPDRYALLVERARSEVQSKDGAMPCFFPEYRAGRAASSAGTQVLLGAHPVA